MVNLTKSLWKGLYCISLICLIPPSKDVVVAVGSHLSSIENKWEKLEEMVPRLSMIGDDPDSVYEYVQAKIQSMYMTNKTGYVLTTFLVYWHDYFSTDLDKNPQLEELNVMEKKFNLPNETLVASAFLCKWLDYSFPAYPAAYWLKIPRTGIMYISGNYVGFSSPMLVDPVLIAFREVTGISKSESQVNVHTAKTLYTFGILFKVDEVDTILHQLWRRAMENMGRRF